LDRQNPFVGIEPATVKLEQSLLGRIHVPLKCEQAFWALIMCWKIGCCSVCENVPFLAMKRHLCTSITIRHLLIIKIW
jgi:hypothetical protein